ncbi:histidine kinase N-terminal 7TM domain-containing protein [Paenibacillus sp. sgz302251]|uniref:sensor histidine kinase n=1 Tax=Paenibacillus sp. sgz302251 TaxID=3414493 RepID=UPI003C7AB8CC
MSLDKYLVALLLVSTCLMLFISYLSFRKRNLPIAKYSAYMMLAASFYSFGYAFEIISADLDRIKFWLRVEYIGIPFISTFWLILVIHFTGHQAVLKRWVMQLLFLAPVLTLLFHFTNDLHHFYYRDLQMDYNSIILGAKTLKGPWYWVHISYNYIQAAVGIFLFAAMYLKAMPIVRKQIMAMMLGAAAPWLFNVVYLFGAFGLYVDLTPIGFTLTGIFYIWGIYRFNLLRLAPVAMQKMFEMMQDGVIFLDYDNNIIHSNQSAKAMFEALQHVKDNASSARHVFSNEPELLSKIMVMENSESEVAIRRKEEIRYYQLKVSMITDKAQVSLGKMLIINDITQTIDYQERLLSNVKQLGELLAFKDKLFTVVAHDIRDPLAILINLTELLEEELQAAGSGNIEIFQEVSGQVRNTYTVVENLLDWLRSQRGMITFSPLVWNLAPIVQQAIHSARIRSEIKEIRMTCEIDDEIQIFADKEILDMVLRNLFSNAIKFTGIGGSIRIEARADKDHVIVSVQDTGVGIHPDIVKSLFHEAQEAPAPGTEGEKGTGLGLFLASEFVQIHGGTIWLDSILGHGSTFYFSLPAKKAERDTGKSIDGRAGGHEGHEGHHH